jgi:isoaspartyl peptidase/L-asparaginase-like protein (Ntn-hydrolase superfamily)
MARNPVGYGRAGLWSVRNGRAKENAVLLLANSEGRPGVAQSVELLKTGENGLRAIIEGVKIVEADPDIHTVGRASRPNLLGELQLDAAVMDGNTRRTGAVGALRGFLHPVEVAYAVMQRLDHEILVGDGAERFAEEIGAERSRNETEFSVQTWEEHMDGVLTAEQKKAFPNLNLLGIKLVARDPEQTRDTTVYLSRDRSSRISTATSTSGWAWKYPGRLGDSPIIGAGSYADSRYGACACTHLGEMAIRAGTARSVVLYLKLGYPLRDAVLEAAKDLAELRTGFLGEVTIHAIDAKGGYFVLGVNSSKTIQYLVWDESMPAPETREAEIYRSA